MNKKTKIINLSLMIIVFFILGLMVRGSREGILFDVVVMEYVHSYRIPWIFRFMKFISLIGSQTIIVPGAAIALSYSLIKKDKYASKLIFLSSAGSWILNFLLKQIFHRTRPLEYFLVEQGGYSFPSAHSMVTTTLFLTIAHLLGRRIKDERNKRVLNIIAFTIILLMGISRMYLGVHWPTDVIGGYLIGYVFYYLSVNLVKK